MKLPKHSQLQKQGCWVTAGLQQPPDSVETFSVAYKKSQVPGTTHRQPQAEGNAITKVQVRSPAGRKHQAGWTVLSHPLGGTSRSSSRWERWICGVPPTSTQTKAAAVLHLTPFPGVKRMVFKSFPPHYPRASGTQPCDITEPDCPISPRALCALGCCVPQSLLWSLSLFHLFYTCLCRYIETNCFVFSCLQESLISVCPLLPITPVTHHWRQEHRDCRKIYIYLHP